MRKLLFLFLLLNMAAAAAEDFESERGSRVSWVRLKFPVRGSSARESAWDWHAHPTGDLRMIDFLRRNSSVNLKADWNVVDVEQLDKMCAFPFIFMHGQRDIRLSPAAENNIREYLLRGGLLYVDDCVYRKYDPYQDMMYRSTRELLERLLPGIEFQNTDLKKDELYRCYYTIRFFPHCQGKNNGIQLAFYRKRLVAILTSSDFHCGWTSEHWFSPKITNEAFRLGTNIYVYSMCH